MPGFDGTGPMGMGPRTGGGFGYCPPAGDAVAPYGFGLGRGGRPWGGGRGFGFGGGRGRGWRGRWGGMPAWTQGIAPVAPTPDVERAALRQQIDGLSRQLEAMQARVAELDAQAEQQT